MDTLKVKTFLLIEKYKSFSQAAAELSYTPSAISHMADSLEDELGIKLFNRTKKGVSLTDAGKKLYNNFSAVYNAEKKLFKAASDLSEQNQHTLRIGAYSSIALHFLPGVLQSFKTAYPAVKTAITVDDNMHDWLEKGIVDVIFADSQIASDQWHPLLEDEYMAVVPENEFFSKAETDVKSLYGRTFIKYDEVNLENYLDYEKFSDIIEVNSIENNSSIYMVKEGLGITVLPKLSIKSLPKGVKALKLNPKISRTIGIIYNATASSWACEKFIRHIKKSSFF